MLSTGRLEKGSPPNLPLQSLWLDRKFMVLNLAPPVLMLHQFLLSLVDITSHKVSHQTPLPGHKGQVHFHLGFQTHNFPMQIQSLVNWPSISRKIVYLMVQAQEYHNPFKSLGCHSSSSRDQLEVPHPSILKLTNQPPHRCLLRATIQLSGSNPTVGLLQGVILCLHKWGRFPKTVLDLVCQDHKYPWQTPLGSRLACLSLPLPNRSYREPRTKTLLPCLDKTFPQTHQEVHFLGKSCHLSILDNFSNSLAFYQVTDQH